MYKNQLQELAQRSCFNLPSYACIREGPDHAPRFRASVNFHGEIFEGPSYCPTVRQAEHAAAEVALSNLSTRGTSRSLAARVLDETGVYKNLLQETAHRAGLKLPVYTTIRSGPGHQPVFTCSVELAGMSFNGEPAKTKKQAEKNAAMAAWSALKQMPDLGSLQSKETESGDDHEQAVVARVLSNFKPGEENRPVSQRRIMASPHNAPGFKYQWRFDDLRSHEPLIYKSQDQERHRSFLTLAPQNGPKILPPSTSKDKNINFVPSQLEARKEEDDRISEILDGKGKAVSQDIGPRPTYQRIIPLPYQRPQQTHRPFGLHFYPVSRNSASASLPRTMGSGGFRGLAPAVHVRSVIPVCAVPPPTRPSPSSSGVEKKEDGGDISTTSLKVKLDKLQL